MQNCLNLKEEQAKLLIQALSDLKAKSGHAVATKQVCEKIDGLTLQNKQLELRVAFLEQQKSELEQ